MTYIMIQQTKCKFTTKDSINPITLDYNARQVDRDNYKNYGAEARVAVKYLLKGMPTVFAGGIRAYSGNTKRNQLGIGTTGSDFDLTLTNPQYGKSLAFGTTNYAIFAENIFQIGKRLKIVPGIRFEYIENKREGYINTTATGELNSENAKLQGEVKSLNGKVTGLETEVATLKTDNKGFKGQIQNLREDNQNISYELTVANEHLEEAIKVAETPFINGWVYDPARGWIFTDAEHFPLVYTDNDQTWNYYELGSSDPRYLFNYSTQEWVAWDTVPEEVEQTVAANTNL